MKSSNVQGHVWSKNLGKSSRNQRQTKNNKTTTNKNDSQIPQPDLRFALKQNSDAGVGLYLQLPKALVLQKFVDMSLDKNISVFFRPTPSWLSPGRYKRSTAAEKLNCNLLARPSNWSAASKELVVDQYKVQ